MLSNNESKTEVPNGAGWEGVEMMKSDDYRFGWKGYRPKWFRHFESIKWAVFFLCFGPLIQGAVVNGILHYFVTTIEKSYGLTSVMSGLMCGAYDIASLLCVIPVTYWGGQQSTDKPRWIGSGIVVMGAGALVFAVPGLQRRPPPCRLQASTLCTAANLTGISSACLTESEGGVPSDFLFFFIGNFLQGVGASPIFTLAIAYIDENAPKGKGSIYTSIYFTMVLLGPALGFVVGAYLIKVHTNFIYPQLLNEGAGGETVGGSNDPENPLFVGCWWLGFMVFGFAAILAAMPITALPKCIKPPSISTEADAGESSVRTKVQNPGGATTPVGTGKGNDPGESSINTKVQNPVETRADSQPGGSRVRGVGGGRPGGVKGLWVNLARLLLNPVFLALSFAGCSEGLLISGFGVFLPKLLQVQFNVHPGSIAVILGAVVLPSSLAGLILGGWVVSKLKANVRKTVRYCVANIAAATGCVALALISCNDGKVVGITVPYANAHPDKPPLQQSADQKIALDNPCNENCYCDPNRYEPVCSFENKVYFSACYAGCRESTANKNEFWNCSCLPAALAGSSLPGARSGPCPNHCPLYVAFIILLFLYQLFTFSTCMPTITATLRVVSPDSKSLAMGVQWVLVRLLATIPGPVVFGKVIDNTCIYSLHSWGPRFCAIYNSKKLSLHLAAFGFICNILTLVCVGVAWALVSRSR